MVSPWPNADGGCKLKTQKQDANSAKFAHFKTRPLIGPGTRFPARCYPGDATLTLVERKLPAARDGLITHLNTSSGHTLDMSRTASHKVLTSALPQGDKNAQSRPKTFYALAGGDVNRAGFAGDCLV
jgi:hypothetical protein